MEEVDFNKFIGSPKQIKSKKDFNKIPEPNQNPKFLAYSKYDDP